MAYTETEHRGYFQRLGDSFKGILFGVVLFCASTYGLYWNETRVNLFEIANQSVEYSPKNEKKFISYTGIIETINPLSDKEYLNPIYNIIALSRDVEMYSWKESSHTQKSENMDGSFDKKTTYTYEKVWSSSPEDSSTFKISSGHINPKSIIQTGHKIYKVDDLTIGNFKLLPNRLKITPKKSLILNDQNLKMGYIINNNYIYIGKGSATNSKIGDIRISYKSYPSKIEATTFGILKNRTIKPYKIKDSNFIADSSGGLYRLFKGDRAEALGELKSEEKMILWVIRILSIIIMFSAFNLIFGPINAVFNIFHLSSITKIATRIVSGILTLIIATIAILFGKLASIFSFYGAIIVIIGAIFIVIKFIFTKENQN